MRTALRLSIASPGSCSACGSAPGRLGRGRADAHRVDGLRQRRRVDDAVGPSPPPSPRGCDPVTACVPSRVGEPQPRPRHACSNNATTCLTGELDGVLTLNCFPPTLIGLEKMKADLTDNAYESVVGPVQLQRDIFHFMKFHK